MAAGLVGEPPPAARLRLRPTWAEVDLRRLAANLRRFRARMGPRTRVMFVVKGNAYGHGAAACSRAAEDSGAAAWLGVSSVEEGVALREAGIRLPILVLGSLYPFESFQMAALYGLAPTVASLEAARQIASVARGMAGQPAAGSSPAGTPRSRGPIACHLKLDTGMGRIGVGWPSGMGLARFLAQEPTLRLEGVYTHLADAEGRGAATRLQLRRFRAALADMRRQGIRVPLVHAANSAAALRHPDGRFGMVRPGLAVYGLAPGFEPALALKSRIVFLKSVQAGTPVSYGSTFRTRRPSRLATLPIGYADGYSRALSNKARVLVGGRRCPVVGTVTMDMTMVDVTRVPQARVGDEAVLIGRQGREEVTAGELARLSGTIPYETVTQLAGRVPRVYLR